MQPSHLECLPPALIIALWDLSSLPVARVPFMLPDAPSVCPTVNTHSCRAPGKGVPIILGGMCVGYPDCLKAVKSQQGWKDGDVEEGILTPWGQCGEGPTVL